MFRKQMRRVIWPYFLAAAILSWSVCAGVVYSFVLPREITERNNAWHARLNAMADDRRIAIDEWLTAGRGSIRVISESSALARFIGIFETEGILSTQLTGAHDSARRVLDMPVRHMKFDAMVVIDETGKPIHWSTGTPDLLLTNLRNAGPSADPGVEYVDFYFQPGEAPLVLYTAPITSDRSFKSRYAVYAFVRPRNWLYPLLTREPVPTASAETFLVRREGDRIRFLTPLRHNTEPAGELTLPADTPQLPAREAVDKDTAFGEYTDYRGAPVLAATSRLKNAPWGIVVKVDRTEVLAGAYEEAQHYLFVALAIATGLCGVAYGFVRRQASSHSARLAASEKLFHTAIDNFPGPVVLYDADERYQYLNNAALGFVRMKLPQLIGQRDEDILPEEFYRRFKPMLKRCMESGELQQFDLALDLEGRPLDLLVSYIPIFGGEGIVRNVLVVSVDITARRQAEKHLEEAMTSLKEMEAIVNKSPAVAFLCGAEDPWPILFISENVRQFGYEPGQFLGHENSYAGLVHPDDLLRIGEESVRFISEGRSEYTQEYRIRCANGDERWVNGWSWVRRDVDGKPTHIQGIIVDITARKIAEKRLIEANVAYREMEAIVDRSPAVAFVWNAEAGGAIEYVSENVRQFGYDAHTLIENRTLYASIVYRDDVDTMLAEVERFESEDRNGFEQEYRLCCKNGDIRWVADWTQFRRDATGKITHHQGIVIDITDRKKMEQALKDSVERTSAILDTANCAIVTLDSEGRFLRWNSYCREFLGYTDEEMGSLSLHDLMLEADRDAILARVASIRRGDVTQWRVERAYKRKDGTRIWGDVSGAKLPGRAEYIAIVADITSRKRAEGARALLETAIHQAAEAIVITRTDATIEYVNPAFEQVSGYTKEEAIGRTPSILKSGMQAESTYDELWSTITRGDIWSGRFINKRKNGTLYEAECTISPVRDSTGAISNYVGVSKDVTRESQLEKQMRQIQKLEAIGTLAGGIAHDFNNILSAMLGYTELAKNEVEENSRTWDDLEHVLQACYRARDLVSQILTFSRQTEHSVTPLSIHLVVKEAMKLLKATIPSTIEIVESIDVKSGLVLSDPTLIHQIVMNLCTNAYQAIKDQGHGQISVTLAPFEVNSAFAEFHPPLKPGPYIRFAVEDTGIGMDAATVDRIFEPFFTTKPLGQGTGLGLSTVHGIVVAQEGGIFVDSELGKGSRFEVYLPRCLRTPAPTLRAANLPPRGNGERALVVDDEPAIVRLVQRMLAGHGYAADVFTSSVEAIEAFKKAPEKYALVVSDFTMPAHTGKELAQIVRSIRSEIPVIIMTGFSEKLVQEGTIDPSISKLVLKPLSRSELLQAVHDVLNAPRGETLETSGAPSR
jgi:PAS domain S-box-containing protein